MQDDPSQQSSNSQWVATPIKLSLRLSPKSMKPEVPFFALISREGGYMLPHNCSFMLKSISKDSFVVQIHMNSDHIGFYSISRLDKISVMCSKLNFGSSLGCSICVKLEAPNKNEVIFEITAPNMATENRLLKTFEIF